MAAPPPDASRLDEMPPGRTPVRTRVVEVRGPDRAGGAAGGGGRTARPQASPTALTPLPRQDQGEALVGMWGEVLRELTSGDPPGRAFVVYPLRQPAAARDEAEQDERGSAAAAARAAAEDLKNATVGAALWGWKSGSVAGCGAGEALTIGPRGGPCALSVAPGVGAAARPGSPAPWLWSCRRSKLRCWRPASRRTASRSGC
jgi:hypothetical protein